MAKKNKSRKKLKKTRVKSKVKRKKSRKKLKKNKKAESKELIFKVSKKWSSKAYINKTEYEKIAKRVNPYGDGSASKYIYNAIEEYLIKE